MILTNGGGANLYLICPVILSPIVTPEVKEGNKLKNKALGWLIRPVKSLANDQQGVTGLETAIILIAFVVVASVFAFTVLSTGIFSAERGKETIHAGLSQARSSVELKGSIVSVGVREVTLSNGDVLWTAGAGVNPTLEEVDKKEGIGSAELDITTAAVVDVIAGYIDLAATVDMSSTDSVQLWLKAGTSTTAAELKLVLDNDAGCASGTQIVALPSVVGGTWNLVTVAVDASVPDMNVIKCVGLKFTEDNGDNLVNLDNIVGRGQATNVIITLTNALEGEPIDMTEPSDSDADGTADPDSVHSMILTYTDKDQVQRDVYWTQDFIGQSDGDDLLEAGEKVEITVKLGALDNATPLVAGKRFDLEIRPQDGGVAVIERTMPDIIDLVMNLK